jgi:hypothetical protein
MSTKSDASPPAKDLPTPNEAAEHPTKESAKKDETEPAEPKVSSTEVPDEEEVASLVPSSFPVS